MKLTSIAGDNEMTTLPLWK